MKKSILLLSSTLFAAAAGTLFAVDTTYGDKTYVGTVYTYVGDGAEQLFSTAGLVVTTFDPDASYSEYTSSGIANLFSASNENINTSGTSTALNTLRFVAGGTDLDVNGVTKTTVAETVSVDFANLALGGLIVEENATGYSMAGNAAGRSVYLGTKNTGTIFYGTINENFTITPGTGVLYNNHVKFDGTHKWSIASGKTLKLAAVWDVNAGADVEFSGGGNIVSDGGGTTDNIVAGSTVSVTGSGTTLQLNGNLNFRGTLNVGSGATFTMGGGNSTTTIGGNLVVDGDVSLGGTKKISGNISGTGTIALSGATTISGTIDLSSAISNSGTITFESNPVFVLDHAAVTELDGTRIYTLINNVDSGSITGWSSLGKNNFQKDGATLGGRQTLDVLTAGVVKVTGVLGIVWNGTGGSNSWNTTANNWNTKSTSPVATAFISASGENAGDNVFFTNDGYQTVNATENVIASSIVIQSGNYTFTADGSCSITTGDMTIDEGASLTFAGSVLTSINGIVNNGTLNMSDATFEGTNSGTMNLSGSSTFSGTNSKVLNLSGTTTFSGTNLGTVNANGTTTFAGTNSGTLNITGGTTTWAGTNSGSIDISQGATLDLGVKSGTINFPVSGEGTVKLDGSDSHGTILNLGSGFTGTVDYTGKIGAAALGNSSSVSKLVLSTKSGSTSSIWYNGTKTIAPAVHFKTNYQIGDNGWSNNGGVNLTFSGNISAESGTTVTVSRKGYSNNAVAATFSGSNVQFYTLSVADAGTIVNFSNNSGTTTINTLSQSNGTVNVASKTTTITTLNASGGKFSATKDVSIGTLTRSSGNSFTLEGGADATITVGTLSGTKALTKAGAGTLLLSNAASTFSGTITISAGTLKVGNASALGTGNVSVGNGAKIEITTTMSLSNVTFNAGAKLVIGGNDLNNYSTIVSSAQVNSLALFSLTQTNVPTGEQKAITIATGAAFDNAFLSNVSLSEDFVSAANSLGYTHYTFDLDDGNLILTLSVPEPSAFGLLAGLGALALAGTRRRRKAK